MSKDFSDEQASKELEKGYDKAEKILKDQDKLDKFFDDLSAKMKSVPLVGEVFSNIPTLASLIKSYATGEYKEAPMGTIVALISALLYFILPIDVLPDVIPGIGLIDDAAVLTACLAMCQSDVEAFKIWKKNKQIGQEPVEVIDVDSEDLDD